MADEEQANNQTDDKRVVVNPKKFYLKDVSFESPNAPTIFTADWDPELAVDIDQEVSELTDKTHDVVLTITAKATVDDTTAFLVEVHQGGIFFIQGYDSDELQRVLNVICLRTLYPYACAVVDSLIIQGGFPPILLGHINFGARYKQMLEQATIQNEETTE